MKVQCDSLELIGTGMIYLCGCVVIVVLRCGIYYSYASPQRVQGS